MAVLRHKRRNLPSPTGAEKSRGTIKFAIAEDLTGPTYRKLRELQKREEVNRAWTIDGRFRFTLADDPLTIRRVKSVFLSVEDILNQ